MAGGGGSGIRSETEMSPQNQQYQCFGGDAPKAVYPEKLPVPLRRRKTAQTLLSDIRIHGDVAYVTLTRGYVATIDARDAELVGRHNWQAAPREHVVYAQARQGNGKLLMHRLVCDAPPELEVDHRDGDGLNNRRANLRPATNLQQAANKTARGFGRSPYRGVSWNAQRGKWMAIIGLDGCRKYLGLFRTQEEAREAYAAASREHRGEFHRADIDQTRRAAQKADRDPVLREVFRPSPVEEAGR